MNENRYFLSFFEFNREGLDPEMAADILLEEFTGDARQLEQLLDILLSDDKDPSSGIDRLETLEVTSDEMVAITELLKDMRETKRDMVEDEDNDAIPDSLLDEVALSAIAPEPQTTE